MSSYFTMIRQAGLLAYIEQGCTAHARKGSDVRHMQIVHNFKSINYINVKNAQMNTKLVFNIDKQKI